MINFIYVGLLEDLILSYDCLLYNVWLNVFYVIDGGEVF